MSKFIIAIVILIVGILAAIGIGTIVFLVSAMYGNEDDPYER